MLNIIRKFPPIRVMGYLISYIGVRLMSGKDFRKLLKSQWKRIPSKDCGAIRSELSDEIELELPHGAVMIRATNRSEAKRAQALTKEPWTLDWLSEVTTDDDVFYDVGSNIGAYAFLAVAGLNKKNVRAVCFEGMPGTFNTLCWNIERNNLGKAIVPIPIYLAEDTKWIFIEGSSFDSGAAEHKVAEQKDRREETVYVRQHALPVDKITKDLDLPEPTLLKIDVDGAEVSVIKGAYELLRSDKLRSILIEVDQDKEIEKEVFELITQAGFSLEREIRREDSRNLPNYFIFKSEK